MTSSSDSFQIGPGSSVTLAMMMTLIVGCIASTVAAMGCFLFVGLVVYAGRVMVVQRQRHGRTGPSSNPPHQLGFFHPRCSGGGGGERVLWKMVETVGRIHANRQSDNETASSRRFSVVIYTIEPPSPTYKQDVLAHVQNRFSLDISPDLPLSFVHLHQHAHLLDPAPTCSLLLEAWGTLQLAWRALSTHHSPDLWIDTTGCAFAYIPAVLWWNCRVLSYTHYPTLSTDMLQLVWERRRTAYRTVLDDNNNNAVADATPSTPSTISTYLKLVYYCGFAILYGAAGSLASLVLVNSTWTYHHVAALYKGAAWRNRIRIVFPPCSLVSSNSDENSSSAPATTPTTLSHLERKPVVLSIGQFRPEKDHVLQIQAFARLLEKHPSLRHTTSNNNNNKDSTEKDSGLRLVLAGSCRGASDDARLQHLRTLTHTLGLDDVVDFVVNQRFAVLQQWLSEASLGIHTMWNEHFGIGIVEMMAAGVIVVAHRSGGPQSDIVSPPRTGFLAASVEEYADSLYRALTLPPDEANAIRQRAQQSALRFTDQVFAESFETALLDLKILQ